MISVIKLHYLLRHQQAVAQRIVCTHKLHLKIILLRKVHLDKSKYSFNLVGRLFIVF